MKDRLMDYTVEESAAYHAAREEVFRELLEEATREHSGAERRLTQASANGIRRKTRILMTNISPDNLHPDELLDSAAYVSGKTLTNLTELRQARHLHLQSRDRGMVYLMEGFLPDGTWISMRRDWKTDGENNRVGSDIEFAIIPVGQQIRQMTSREQRQYDRLRPIAEKITNLAKARAGLR